MTPRSCRHFSVAVHVEAEQAFAAEQRDDRPAVRGRRRRRVARLHVPLHARHALVHRAVPDDLAGRLSMAISRHVWATMSVAESMPALLDVAGDDRRACPLAATAVVT